MKQISEDFVKGVVTYQLADGRVVSFSARDIAEYGIEALMRHSGLADQLPTGRLPVYQRGKKIGTVPAAFEPLAIKSTSFFYQPRGGDFTRDGDKWTACPGLGPGDFDAIPGFIWQRGGAD